jgi:hypothetical protein
MKMQTKTAHANVSARNKTETATWTKRSSHVNRQSQRRTETNKENEKERVKEKQCQQQTKVGGEKKGTSKQIHNQRTRMSLFRPIDWPNKTICSDGQ